MDHITKSLQCYLKCAEYRFCTRAEDPLGTSTNIETFACGENIRTAILIDINPHIHTINMSALPYFIVEGHNINSIKTIQRQWRKKERFSYLSINEEGGTGACRFLTVQLRINILSDGNGLTRTLWHRYIKLLLVETTQIYQSVSSLKSMENDVDLLLT